MSSGLPSRRPHRSGLAGWLRGRHPSEAEARIRRELDEANRRLQAAEDRYPILAEHVPAVTYAEDASTKQPLFVSPQVERILGFTPEEWMSSAEFSTSRVHPEDRDVVVNRPDDEDTWSADYRIIAKDGRTVWVHDTAALVRDPDGGPRAWHGMLFDISRRKEFETRLVRAEDRLRKLIEQLPVTVYIDAVDNVSTALYESPQFEQLTGYPSEIRQSRPDYWANLLLHEADRDRVLAESARTNKTGDPFEIEYRIVRKDGTVRWVHDHAVLAVGAEGEAVWQGVIEDITDRKLAEETIREAEERFRAIVEHMPAAIYVDRIDTPPRPLYVSPQIERITGMTKAEWMSATDAWIDLIHPEDRGWVIDAYTASVVTRRPFSAEYRMITKDGRPIWVQDETTYLRDHAGHELIQGVIFDITEQKLAEHALRDSERRERDAAERLRALDEMKNTFLAAVSHELRSPLTSILGLSLTLDRSSTMSDEDRRDLLGRLAANARKLDRLLEDLLDIDRLNRGIVTPNYRTTDLGALATRTLGSLELGDKDVSLRVDPVVMEVDPAKVERIVENLLTNAVRHTPAEAKIWLDVAARDGGVLIRVDDDGPGVPQDLREAIFEPFRQGPTAATHAPGTGVGLSLVSRFSALHGGRAWVEPRDGGGASFRVFLPAPGDAPADGPLGILRSHTDSRPESQMPESQMPESQMPESQMPESQMKDQTADVS